MKICPVTSRGNIGRVERIVMTPYQQAPTVFIVDDDAAVREYLTWLIESVGLTVEGYPAARAFLDGYDPERPGCLLLDVRMPGMSGIELQEELVARRIALPIIMMTGYAEIPMAVRVIRAGALDFIQKPFSDQVLLERIRDAIELDGKTRQMRQDHAEVSARLGRLTARQREVLDGVLAGKASKVIAWELKLSPKTVDVHRCRIMRTMQASSLPDLFRLIQIARD